jgi:hypothetical protein
MLLTALGFLLAGIVFFSLWSVYGRLVLFGSKYYYGYSRLPTRSSAASSPSFSPTRRKLRMIPLFLQQRASLKKGDEETGSISETIYELASRNVRD